MIFIEINGNSKTVFCDCSWSPDNEFFTSPLGVTLAKAKWGLVLSEEEKVLLLAWKENNNIANL